MKILPLTLGSLTKQEKQEFFKDYPFEKFYTLHKKMDVNRFVDFLIDKLDKRIKMDPNIWYVSDNGIPVTIFGLAKEIELSNSYGKNIHLLGSYYNFKPRATEALTLINKHVDQFCGKNPVDIVRCKMDVEDRINMGYLLSQKYQYYASSRKVYYDIDRVGLPSIPDRGAYTIRPYEIEDKDAVLALIKQHKKNELYYNPDLSSDDTERILQQYFLNYSSHSTSKALVLEDSTKKKLVGVSLYTSPSYFNSWLTKPLITWDMIVISEESQGNGLGELFFNSIVRDHTCDIEGSTMSNNTQMLKLLHRLGFHEVCEFKFLYKRFDK